MIKYDIDPNSNKMSSA